MGDSTEVPVLIQDVPTDVTLQDAGMIQEQNARRIQQMALWSQANARHSPGDATLSVVPEPKTRTPNVECGMRNRQGIHNTGCGIWIRQPWYAEPGVLNPTPHPSPLIPQL